MSFAVTFLGTGTSVGVPMIGCTCPVCTSGDPRNRRRRSALYVRLDDAAFVIDTPPDFRDQALENKLTRLDAIVYTHAHADHILGLDDVRRFNTLQGNRLISTYAVRETMHEIRRIFDYIGPVAKDGLFRPLIDFVTIDAPFEICGAKLTPISVTHNGVTHGYRIDYKGQSVGYVPDCKTIEPAQVEHFKGVNLMVLDCLRYRPHSTHLCLEESVALLKEIGAPHSYLTHMCHDFDHATLLHELPAGIMPACDKFTHIL